MAKIGAGLNAQKIQEGTVPNTPSETVNSIVQETMGNLAAEASQEVSRPTPEVTGFTEDDNLVPISQRMAGARKGTLNPKFEDWKKSGNEGDAELLLDDTQDFSPDPMYDTQPTKNPMSMDDAQTSMLNRAKKSAISMLPSEDGESAATRFNTGISASGTMDQKETRDAYIEANYKVDSALTEEESIAAKKERAKIINEMESKDNSILNSMAGKLDALVVNPKNGFATPDPRFLITAQLATEHELDMMFMGQDSSESEYLYDGDTETNGDGDTVPLISNELINPADGAERVGRNIGMWWDAEKQGNTKAGTMSPIENKDLGAQHLLAFAENNPHIVKAEKVRTDDKGNASPTGKNFPWRFRLTPEGGDILSNSREFRQRALGVNIAPESTPKRGGLVGAKAEIKPTYRTKNKLQSKDKSYATLEEFEESIGNQNSVAHVVDNRRMRLATAMLMPTMFGKIGEDGDMFADGFGLGKKSFDTTVKSNKDLKGLDETEAVSEAINITRNKKAEAGKDIKTLHQYQTGPNYLTFAMQRLAGRMMSQQNDFNPTRRKIVRAVTRSKHTATITGKKGRLYNNLMNIYALNFGRDAELSKGRLQDLLDNKSQYYNWGKIIEQALNDVVPVENYNKMSKTIAEGGTLGNVGPHLKQFQDKLRLDPTLVKFIQGKGEDAIAAMDALIDFKRFHDNMDAGRSHTTTVNGYIDGKTNGIANVGMMLGNDKLASRVGVLRPDDATKAVNSGDLRDEMQAIILDRIEQGIPYLNSEQTMGKEENIRYILRAIASHRDINKAVTMVFPYGKELAGLKDEIKQFLPELAVSDPLYQKALEEVTDSGLKEKDILNAAHDSVVYAMFDLFGEDTFNNRGAMRSVGFMHGIMDKLFSIRGPSGHRILLGDSRNDLSSTEQSKVTMRGEQGSAATLNLQSSKRYMSSAADRDGEAGGHVRGRSEVIPTQSMDAATVVRTSTGSSWDKMKEAHPQGDPYFFQIYDAYKVDVHNYDVVAEEVNKNFMDITTRDWNFIEEAKKEYNKLLKDSREVLSSNTEKKNTFKGGTHDYLYSLMDPNYVTDAFGNQVAKRSAAKAFIKAAFPIDPSGSVWYDSEGNIRNNDGSKPSQIPSERIKGYDEYINNRTAGFQNALIKAFNVAAGSGQKINAKDFMFDQLPKEISNGQVLKIIDTIEHNIKLQARLSRFTDKTNRQRKDLRQKVDDQVRRTGIGALQFWAH